MHIKVPSETTILRFYENLNYGMFVSHMMKESLHIPTQGGGQQRLYTERTVEQIQEHIRSNLGQTWVAVTRKKAAVDFNNNRIQDTVSAKLTRAWRSRETWMNDVAPIVIHDMRTPVIGEDLNAMVFSDMDSDLDEHLENEDDVDSD